MLDFAAASKHDDDDIDFTPIMDIMFILLIFFVIASAFTVRGMTLDLPPAQSSKGISGRVVTMRLDQEGNIYDEETLIPRAELRVYIHGLVQGFAASPAQLVLQADPNAPVEALITLVDEVRLQGGEQLMIATSPPGSAVQP